MDVFRICKEEYSKRIVSSGSANRWNLRGQNVVYAGSSRSLSTLELVVHRNAIAPNLKYRVMVISIAEEKNTIRHIDIKSLPNNWRTLAAYSQLQKMGSDWYHEQESLILKVPSAVIPLEYNYLINTEHPDFKTNISLIRDEDYFWDNRLF